MYDDRFLSRRFTDRREILHAVRPDLRQAFFLFWEDSPTDGRTVGVNRGHMEGYASC